MLITGFDMILIVLLKYHISYEFSFFLSRGKLAGIEGMAGKKGLSL
jgi:hypothetical protein